MSAMHILIVSGSLNPGSRSRIMAQAVRERLEEKADVAVTALDLREKMLPFCDGDAAYGHASVAECARLVADADAILVASPVYNYDVNAAVKNFVELTGRSWTSKVVGFLCAAGGQGSYMSIMPFANSLMLDFRCLVIPRFVYATKTAFEADRIVDGEVRERISELCDMTVALAKAMSQLSG